MVAFRGPFQYDPVGRATKLVLAYGEYLHYQDALQHPDRHTNHAHNPP